MAGRTPRAAQDERGFTLVELLVSMTVLGIVASIVMVAVVQTMERAAVATNRTNALTDIERGLERITRQVRVADPLVIDPDDTCDSMTVDRCVDEVLTRRLDAVTFSDGEQVNYSYYLVDNGTDVELRQDVTRIDIVSGAVIEASTGEFIAEIANLDPVVGQPLFAFFRIDPVTEGLVPIDCSWVTVETCKTYYGTASVIEITLMKALTQGEPLRVGTTVNIRNTRYQS